MPERQEIIEAVEKELEFAGESDFLCSITDNNEIIFEFGSVLEGGVISGIAEALPPQVYAIETNNESIRLSIANPEEWS